MVTVVSKPSSRNHSGALFAPVVAIITMIISIIFTIIIAAATLALIFTRITRISNTTDSKNATVAEASESIASIILSTTILLKEGSVNSTLTIDCSIFQNEINAKLNATNVTDGISPFFVEIETANPQHTNGSITIFTDMIIYYVVRCSRQNCSLSREAAIVNLLNEIEIRLNDADKQPIFVQVTAVNLTLITEVSSSNATVERIKLERNRIPLSRDLSAIVVRWDQVVIPLVRFDDVLAIDAVPSFEDRVDQTIHDLNTVVNVRRPAEAQNVFFVKVIGNPTYTREPNPSLTATLESVHNRACVNCTTSLVNSLKAAILNVFVLIFDGNVARPQYEYYEIKDVANLKLNIQNMTNITISTTRELYEQRNLAVRTGLLVEFSIQCRSGKTCPIFGGVAEQSAILNAIIAKFRTLEPNDKFEYPFAIADATYHPIIFKPNIALGSALFFYNRSIRYNGIQDMRSNFNRINLNDVVINFIFSNSSISPSNDITTSVHGVFVDTADWDILIPLS